MHFYSALTTRKIARIISAFLLTLIVTACGSGDAGNQSDQRPPVAKAEIIGLVADTSTSAKIFSTRANNKITLTGKNSIAPDTPILTYKWQQLSGEPVTLIAHTGDSSTFTTPNLATTSELRFQLTVTDANQKTDTDTLVLTVAPVDDVDRFLSNPLAPNNQLRILAALQGGATTGSNDQPFSIQAVTIAHWRNRLGTMDQMEIHTETRNSVFPGQYAPAADYDPFTEPRNPQLLFAVQSVDVDTINQYFNNSDRHRRLEPHAIGSVYLEIRLNIIGTPSVDFELFALNDLNILISGSNILSTTPPSASPTTSATNGALLQTWNNEFSALITSDSLLAALGLENKTSANNYYLLLDPTAQFTRLQDWLIYAGFKNTDGKTSTDPSITRAEYFNNYDLSYGRSAWMRKDANGNVFSYVINYPTVEDALKCHKDFSVFAMEYSDNPDAEGINSKIVKFYAFIPNPITGDYFRTNSINIDGRGEKMVPGVCTSCHQTNVAPSQFNSLTNADLGAVFLPFDLDAFLYASAKNPALIEPTFNASTFTTAELTKHSKESQEAAFRALNLNVLATYTANPLRHSAAIELVHGWYGDLTPDLPPSTGEFSSIKIVQQSTPDDKSQKMASKKRVPIGELPNTPFNGNYVQPGWIGEEALYRDVFSRNCRTCHVQLENLAANFDTYNEFINSSNLISHVYEQGLMPLSRVTMDRFWVPFNGKASSADLLRNHLESLNQTIPAAPGLPVPKFTVNPKILTTGQPVTLNASGSNFASSYLWSLTAPNGSNATLSSSSGVLSSFTPDIATGNYTLSLTVTNTKNTQATLTQTLSITNLIPVAECFNANTSDLSNAGLLAAIPVLDFINDLGDGGVTIESVTNGSLGVAVIDQDGLSISYQLNDPFVRGVDTISYRLKDADGSLSSSSPNCTSSPMAGFATITIDTTAAGTFAPGAVSAMLDPNNNANQVILTWNAPTATAVDGYNIYRNGSSTPVNTSLITTNTFTDIGLSENTAYSYDVVSVIGSFKSNPSSTSITTLSLTPTNLIAASIDVDTIQILWTPPTGQVDSYIIYRDSDTTPLVTFAATATEFDDLSVTSGTQYTYKMAGQIGSFVSPLSPAVTGATRPDVPTSVSGAALSDTEIYISWNPVNCDNEASYLLELSSSGLTIPTLLTDVTVSGLTPATDYIFDLTAQCNGVFSQTIQTSPITTQSITPVSLMATSVNTDQVDLNWMATGDSIDSYAIYRNGDPTPIATISAANANYSDTGLSSGSQYSYEVTAIAGSYESPASNNVTGFTYPDAPKMPTAVPISDTEIDVSWPAVNCNTTPNYTLIPSADRSPITTNALGGTVGELKPGTTYTFVVTAECNGLMSAPSPASSPEQTFSLAPSDLMAIGGMNQIELNWIAAFGTVDDYYIYRDGSFYATVVGSETSFIDFELSSGSSASYVVTALSGNAESAPSNLAAATTVPDEPFNLSGTYIDSTSIDVSWGAPSCDGTLSYFISNPDIDPIFTNETGHTITGLKPSSFHDFSVNAVCNGMVSMPAFACTGSCP